MSFYLGLFIFIFSILIGLALMLAGKDMKREKFLLLTSIHFIFLFAFIASLILQRHEEVSVNNYFFTAFICSGIILCGLAWRSNSPLILRYYFSIFALTIPVFLLSPSILLNFLLTTNISSSAGPVFRLKENYFLETQAVSRKQSDAPYYKLIQKKGLFHQNIIRDITFNGKLDSVTVIKFEVNTSITLRGYTSTKSFVSVDVDSVEVKLPLKVVKQGDVEYHL